MGGPDGKHDSTYDTIGTADRTALASLSPNRRSRDRAKGDIQTFERASTLSGGAGAKARRVLNRIAETTTRLREILPASWFDEK